MYMNLKLLLSDGASYAIKTGNMLKTLIPDLKHVVCVCHGLHNLCETLRNDCGNVDTIISFLKRVLIKNKANQRAFS